MNDNNIYDPEDLEVLLKTKSFSELLPEEKAFVLQFVDNDSEYDSIRKTYDVLGTLPELEPSIEPSTDSKDALMAAFALAHPVEEKRSRLAAFWLWFWDTNEAIFRRPAFQLASIALVLTAGTYLVNFETANMADNQDKKELKKEETQAAENPAKTKKTTKETSTNDNSNQTNAGKTETAPPEEKLEVIEDLKLKTDTEGNDTGLDDLLLADEEIVESENDLFEMDINNELTEDVSLNPEDEKKFREKSDEMIQKDVAPSITMDSNDEFSADELIIDGDLDYSDLSRTSVGNSSMPIETQVTIAAEKTNMAEFDSGYVTNTEGMTANNFSSLLNKLHTSQ